MSRYPAPELADLPDDIRAKVLEVQAKAGFVPNLFLALARRPAEWRAFLWATKSAISMLPPTDCETTGISWTCVGPTNIARRSRSSPVTGFECGARRCQLT